MNSLCCFSSQLSGGRSSYCSGKGRSHEGSIKYGFTLVKGQENHPMEDYHVAKFIQHQGCEFGLFAIYDGHLGDKVPAYLQKNLFRNILKEDFFIYPNGSFSKAYERTSQAILSHSPDLGRGGSTALTAILINGLDLWVANAGDSRAVLSKRGLAIDLTFGQKRGGIENRRGFVSNMPGDVARVNDQLAVYLQSHPDVTYANVSGCTDLLIIASAGLWKVMSNQEAVEVAKEIRDPQKAAKQLVNLALNRENKDDISCIVVRFWVREYSRHAGFVY